MTLHTMHLRFSPTVTTLSSDDGGVVDLGPSPAALAETCFLRGQPTAVELERAIDIVEDALMAAKVPRFTGAGLTTSEPSLRQLPGLDVVGATLSRDAVEDLFRQLALIALGMPAPQGSQLTDRDTAAALLILRECMHHLDFASVCVVPAWP